MNDEKFNFVKRDYGRPNKNEKITSYFYFKRRYITEKNNHSFKK